MIANPALRDQLKSLASANGEPLPLFGDESGPPAGFGERSVASGTALSKIATALPLASRPVTTRRTSLVF